MKPITLLSKKQIKLTINRLCYQIAERHGDFKNTVIIGIQPRGSVLASLLTNTINTLFPESEVKDGKLDITFFRDDFGRRSMPLEANSTDLNFQVEKKNIILVDDVLYTGRTIRAALDALGTYGRPNKVELLVLIDRRFSRQLPIDPDYIGKSVDAIDSQKVKVEWGKDQGPKKVTLYTPGE